MGTLERGLHCTMGKFDGVYVLERREGWETCMAPLGMSEEMLKRMLDPKNKVTWNMFENGDGSFTWSTTLSLVPEWNSTQTVKPGERTEVTSPVKSFVTVTKKDENTWLNRTEMAGVVFISEVRYHSYGCTVNGSIEGQPGSYKEEFKKVSPKITGYYQLESETGMFEIFKVFAPSQTKEEFKSFMDSVEMKITENSDGSFTIVERGGGSKQTYTFKLDEEWEYRHESFGIEEKRVATKVGPGAIKFVCKNTKDGKTYEWTVTFTQHGATVDIVHGGLEGHEVYRRGADIEGSWKCVAKSDLSLYLELLEVPADMRKQMIEGKDEFTAERLSKGKLKFNINSPFFPDGDMIVELNENYSVEVMGGQMNGVATECGETMLNVMKFGGKTIAQTEKYTGDFLIVESVVNGCKNAAAKTIFARV